MSLNNHFKSVGDVARAVEAGPVNPLLVYGLLAVLAIGILGAGWFVFTILRERAIANALLKEIDDSPG